MKQESLFKKKTPKDNNLTDPTQKVNMQSPLADRVRPRTLKEFVGQQDLLGKNGVLYKMIKHHHLSSFLLYGPPGTGKTTLAEIIAHETKSKFISFSAVDSSIRTVKKVMQKAEKYREVGKRTIVFIDEIHRFNKAQQDAFLPFVEKGSIILIGATTENPSMDVNSALLSRCKTFIFHKLTTNDIYHVLKNLLTDKRAYPKLTIHISKPNLMLLAHVASGDARKAINYFEMAVESVYDNQDKSITITKQELVRVIGKQLLTYDKHGEYHYDLISALHKSVRNSDVQSALYWLYRMLDGGEDPLYICRRLVRMSTEDIGEADPSALTLCIDAYQTCKFIGLPECKLALAEATVRLALDPKSNELLKAQKRIEDCIHQTGNLPVPLQIRNAPTKFMSQKLGFKHGYMYAENYAHHITSMKTLPKELQGQKFYFGSNYGLESHCTRRMQQLNNYKNKTTNLKIDNFKPD